MQFEKVKEVPKKNLYFSAREDTKASTKALSKLTPGEILVFRTDQNQLKKEMYKSAARKEVRLRTAIRNATGKYVMQRRNFDIYVTCLEQTEVQP